MISVSVMHHWHWSGYWILLGFTTLKLDIKDVAGFEMKYYSEICCVLIFLTEKRNIKTTDLYNRRVYDQNLQAVKIASKWESLRYLL